MLLYLCRVKLVHKKKILVGACIHGYSQDWLLYVPLTFIVASEEWGRLYNRFGAGFSFWSLLRNIR